MKFSHASTHVAALRGASLLLAVAAAAGAQDQTWIRKLGTNRYEWSGIAAGDGAGGVFLGGYTYGSFGGQGAGAIDAWFARYDGDGTLVWVRQFGSSADDFGWDATSDGAGGMFACGRTEGDLGGVSAGDEDAWLARLDGAGNQLWIRQLGTPGADRAVSVASDGTGGVYLFGQTDGNLGGPSTGGDDVWLAHYDGSGDRSWLRQVGTLSIDQAYTAAPDGAGGVFLGGNSRGGFGGSNPGGFSAWFARYDITGNPSWARQLGTQTTDTTRAMAADGAGGVFVGGSTQGDIGGPPLGNYDAWLARYDGAGNQVWVLQLGTNTYDSIEALAADGAGGVVVCGVTGGQLGGPNPGDFDAWLARYDGAGSLTWIRQLGSTGADSARGITVNGAGSVFVSGHTWGDLGGPGIGSNDAFLARYDDTFGALQYCTPATPNSTGLPGRLTATGSNVVASNEVAVTAWRLPPDSFGYFLASQTQDLVPAHGGSQGVLCLGGALSRFTGPGQVMSSGPGGWYALSIDLTSMPTPLGSVAVQPGESWNFQAWHRDANPAPTSNFTDAVSVMFF